MDCPVRWIAWLVVVLAISSAGAGATERSSEPARVDSARSTQRLQALPRTGNERVPVTIYEFRSSLYEIAPRGATDMFKTALVRSGQFRVVERARIAEGVGREKQMNAQGITDGTTSQRQLRGARYVFEGSITEATASQTQRSTGVSIAGLEIGGATNKDLISIDVRVVEVDTGDIVDVVTVRKSIVSDTATVAGIGNILGTVLSGRGRDTTYVPDVSSQQTRKESLDAALREAIDVAVGELAMRFGK